MNSNSKKKTEESFSINLLGLRINASNPGMKTLVVIFAILFFVIIMTYLLKQYMIPVVAAGSGRSVLGSLFKKAISVLPFFQKPK